VTDPSSDRPSAGLFGLGFATNFLDALGVGSFATTTAVLKLCRVIDDGDLPGTLNVGHAIPTVLQAALFLSIIRWTPSPWSSWWPLRRWVPGSAPGACRGGRAGRSSAAWRRRCW